MTYITTNHIKTTETLLADQIASSINSDYFADSLCKSLKALTRKSQLHKIITNSDGSPDYLAVNIYYDTLRSWYATKKIKTADDQIIEIAKLKTKGIYIDYKKLAQLHGCSKETIRRKLVKLEKLRLIKRSFKHRQTVTTKSYNQMIIYVWKDTPHFISKYGISKEYISELKPQTNHEYISAKYNIDYYAKAQVNPAKESRGGIHTLDGTKELIEPFNKLKDRSMKSNFVSYNFKNKNETIETKTKPISSHPEVDRKNTQQGSQTSKLSTKLKKPFPFKPKSLADYHPLPANICSDLRSISGRGFTDNAINQILLDMSKRLTKPSFYSKKGFISYMAKALKYELKDAALTANESFKIKANYSEEDKKIRKQEKFLSEIEYSLQTSPEWHLKKKLAAVLSRDLAYDILSNYQYSKGKGGIFKIHLQNPIDIGEMDKQIILNQVKATQQTLDDKGNIRFIENIEFVCLQAKYQDQSIVNSSNATNDFSQVNRTKTSNNLSEHLASIKDKESIKDLPIWHQIRKYFMNYCFNQAEAIGRDKSWLSKLTPLYENNKLENHGGKQENLDNSGHTPVLTLQPESNFVRDWISSNYLFKLESIAKTLGYKLILQDC